MLEIKTILCPVDFSDCSHAAFELAKELSRRFDAKLLLVHVHVPTTEWYGGWGLADWEGGASVASVDSYAGAARKAAHQELRALEDDCVPEGIAVASRVLDGAPWGEIVNLSTAADMIVMGTHGHRGLTRMLMGSVAERVVRLAECPVLTAHATQDNETVRDIQRILVPVDFSGESEKAFARALELAELLDAELTLMHVTSLIRYAHSQTGVADLVAFEQHVKDSVSEKLEQLAQRAVARGITTQTFVAEGHPGEMIGITAKQRRMDLVLMGSHGRTGVSRAMLGSIAEKTVRLSEVPVLTVR
jgi:nucleotide-binding universal stress UspA family protein